MERTIYKSQVGKILIDQQSIENSVSELAEQIKEIFSQSKSVSVIVLLDGARKFADDLFEWINEDKFILGYINVNSYNGTKSSGKVEVDVAIPSLMNTDVLIIDDIYDSGRTMNYILDMINFHSPNLVKTCVLLKKQVQRSYCDIIDFYCFDIPDKFVVGYGMDFDGEYRDLPYIAQLDI